MDFNWILKSAKWTMMWTMLEFSKLKKGTKMQKRAKNTKFRCFGPRKIFFYRDFAGFWANTCERGPTESSFTNSDLLYHHNKNLSLETFPSFYNFWKKRHHRRRETFRVDRFFSFFSFSSKITEFQKTFGSSEIFQ